MPFLAWEKCLISHFKILLEYNIHLYFAINALMPIYSKHLQVILTKVFYHLFFYIYLGL